MSAPAITAIVVAAVAGVAVGVRLPRRDGKTLSAVRLRSITRFLFLTTQLSALLWVNWSFALATYATIRLQQPLPLETLSETAITVILGTLLCKVLENALEHNNGGIWGKSNGGTHAGASGENESNLDTDL